MSNPLEILFSWQAILVAIGAAGLTQLVKTIYDVRKGQVVSASLPPPPPLVEGSVAAPAVPLVMIRAAAKVGKKSRSVLIDRIILPMCPIVFGMGLAMLIPARPDPIVEYVKLHEIGKSALLIYAAWGAVCGQFADYIFVKVKKKLDEFLPGKEEQ
jgi:hypothetical protein